MLKQNKDKMYLSDFIPEFKRIKESLDYYNLIIIVGDEGTGKTEFVNNYFSNFNDVLINKVDANTPKSIILDFLRNKNIFYKTKVLIYDDTTVKKDLLVEASKYIHQTRSTKKIIVIVNKMYPFFSKLNKYIVHKTRYPTKNELYRYLHSFEWDVNNRENREEPATLRKQIMDLDVYNMRRIQYALEDGFIAGEKKVKEERFNITKMDPYVVSFYVAENLPNLRRIKDGLIDADKLKSVNNRFYLDFIKLHYPNIDKKRLRYPKELLEIIKERR